MANEKQRIYWGTKAQPISINENVTGSIESGQFTITFDGQTTQSLNYNATAFDIASALESLSTIGAGNVSVIKYSDGFLVEFINQLSNTDVSTLSVDYSNLRICAKTVTVEELQTGVPAAATNPSIQTTQQAESQYNEVQLIDLGGATTGTYSISSGYGTAMVTGLDQSSLQAACDSLFGFGNTSVSGDGPFSIYFQGSLSYLPIPTIEIGNNMTDGSPFVTVITEGSAGVHQQDTVSFSTGPAISGNWILGNWTGIYTDTPTGAQWSASGSASVGSVVVTWEDYSSHTPLTLPSHTLKSNTGTHHIIRVTLSDNPTEGAFYLQLNGSGGTNSISYNASSSDVATALGDMTLVSWSHSGNAGGPWVLEGPDDYGPGTFAGYEYTDNYLRSNLSGYEVGFPPVSSFTSDVVSGHYNLLVSFTDTSSNLPTSWLWERKLQTDVNWTSLDIAQNPVCSFTEGIWLVRLTASNADGSSQSLTTQITAFGDSPVAGFSANPLSGTSSLSVDFTNNTTGSSLNLVLTLVLS